MEKAGEKIAGSRYYREFCTRCREPLRVTENRVGHSNYCEVCDPPHMGVGSSKGSPITSDERGKNGGYA